MTEGSSFLEYYNFGFKIYNKDSAKYIAIGGDYKSNNGELGLGMTFLISQLISTFNYKMKEKVYVPFNINSEIIKMKSSYILIKELFLKKNSLIEAKKQGCKFILTKNGKLRKVN